MDTNDTPLTKEEMATLASAGYTWVEMTTKSITFVKGGTSHCASRAEWRAVIEGLRKPPTEDELAFGKDAWIYCNQHCRPHQTGWCTVAPRDKVGLGVSTGEEAMAKCRAWKFPLYADLEREST